MYTRARERTRDIVSELTPVPFAEGARLSRGYTIEPETYPIFRGRTIAPSIQPSMSFAHGRCELTRQWQPVYTRDHGVRVRPWSKSFFGNQEVYQRHRRDGSVVAVPYPSHNCMEYQVTGNGTIQTLVPSDAARNRIIIQNTDAASEARFGFNATDESKFIRLSPGEIYTLDGYVLEVYCYAGAGVVIIACAMFS